ncbi:MAG: hypothetical protein EA384_02000 [Spirochaetaceae bacterium]|nr:MAG: hypothetical protein EA384_02000 [Spirochaetaceae bacterium]
MRTVLVLLTLSTLLAPVSAAADLVTVIAAAGRVETRLPQQRWRPVTAGDEVSLGADISTGFGSHVTLDAGGNRVHVAPLTRVTVESLVREARHTTTELNLRIGRVSAEVRTAEGLSQEFRLRSTQSTASVRGTRFTYDGATLIVDEGRVELSNRLEQRRTVTGGQQSRTEEYAPPVRGDEMLLSRTRITADPVDADGGSTRIRPIRLRPITGSVRVRVFAPRGG